MSKFVALMFYTAFTLKNQWKFNAMPHLIEHIDAIAREKQRNVLYI
jgi:hypothetical protein